MLCAFPGCTNLANGPRQTCVRCRRDFCLHHQERVARGSLDYRCTDPECERYEAERQALRAEHVEERLALATLVPLIGLTALGVVVGLLLDGPNGVVPLGGIGLVMGIVFAVGGAFRAL